MVNYDWFRKFLADELFTARVELNRRNLNDIADHIVQRLETKRLTIVPTFLDDNMYDAQKNLVTDISYKDANAMYTSAIVTFTEYAALKVKKNLQDEENIY
jgi:hypothetical protein